MANGVYKLTAKQASTPYRAGQIQVTTPDGCEQFAASNGLVLAGTLAETVGVSVYFAVGMAEGVAYGNLYGGVCDPQLDVTSVQASWAGCGAVNGTRVQAVFAGMGVFHASDVSWRVATPDGSATGNPTGMFGAAYASNANAASQWCMAPGSYILNAYDNNVGSAANQSMGWDGGVLFLTDYKGCIFFEGTVVRSSGAPFAPCL